MAEETATAEVKEKQEKVPILPPLPPQTVSHNKVDWVLDTFQIIKGKNIGSQYLGHKVTIENLQDFITHIGAPNAVNVLQTWAKRTAWSIWMDCIMPDGSFNMVAFLKKMEDLSASGMKLKEIREKMDEIQVQLSNLLDKGDCWKDKTTGEKSPDLLKVEALNAEFRGYKDMEEKRSKGGKEETADEPAVVTS